MPFFFFLFASWLQPLHFPPWVSWHSEILAFLAVLFSAWQLIIVSAKRGACPTIPLPIPAAMLLGIGLLIGLQWLAGLVPFVGDIYVFGAYILLCTAAMTLGYLSGQRRHELIHGIAVAILVGALVSATISLMQVFELSQGVNWINSMREARRPGANLAQPNQLATLLLMGLASVLFLFELRKFGMLPAALMSFLLLLSLAATESRAGLLGFSVLSVWWFAKYKSIGAQLRPWTMALIGVIYLVLYCSWPILMGEVLQLTGGVLPVNSVAYHRWIIWPQLLQAVLLRPWWGWGAGQVSTAHNAVVDAYLTSEAYTYAHNILIDAALGFGLPITILLMLIAGVWLWRRIQAARQLISWYCLAVAIPVATHSLVEFPFAYAYFLVPVMFTLGALEGVLNVRSALQLHAKSVGMGLLVATVLLVWSSFEYLEIEEDFRVVRFEALRVGQTPPGYQRPNVYLLTQLDALLNGGRIVPRPNMPEQEIELAKAVALRFPWPATQNRYAVALALNGNPQEAARQMRVMRAHHGPKVYAKIRATWILLANEKYPQLQEIQLP